METTRPASMNDYQEMQNIVPVTLSIPVLKMPISPEEVRKESPQTAEIRMLVIGLNRPVTPMRSFGGDGVLILAQTPAWEKARQEIYEASVAGDKGRMLEVMLTLAAEYLELQKPSDIFDFAVPISEA